MKTLLIVPLFLLHCMSLEAHKTLKEKHIYSYSQQCLEYWFYPNHEDSYLKALSKRITDTITHSSNGTTSWSWNSFSFETTYPLDYVEQVIRGAVVEFVKDKSYSYAREITSSSHAKQVSETISGRVLSLMQQSATLGQGIFAPFIGARLKQLVYDYVYGSTWQPTVTPVTYYPSDSCNVCMDDFTPYTQVFLIPCGHDICIQCAERWFFTENKSTCPICRTRVDKQALRESINQLIINTRNPQPSFQPTFFYELL